MNWLLRINKVRPIRLAIRLGKFEIIGFIYDVLSAGAVFIDHEPYHEYRPATVAKMIMVCEEDRTVCKMANSVCKPADNLSLSGIFANILVLGDKSKCSMNRLSSARPPSL